MKKLALVLVPLLCLSLVTPAWGLLFPSKGIYISYFNRSLNDARQKIDSARDIRETNGDSRVARALLLWAANEICLVAANAAGEKLSAGFVESKRYGAVEKVVVAFVEEWKMFNNAGLLTLLDHLQLYAGLENTAMLLKEAGLHSSRDFLVSGVISGTKDVVAAAFGTEIPNKIEAEAKTQPLL